MWIYQVNVAFNSKAGTATWGRNNQLTGNWIRDSVVESKVPSNCVTFGVSKAPSKKKNPESTKPKTKTRQRKVNLQNYKTLHSSERRPTEGRFLSWFLCRSLPLRSQRWLNFYERCNKLHYSVYSQHRISPLSQQTWAQASRTREIFPWLSLRGALIPPDRAGTRGQRG